MQNDQPSKLYVRGSSPLARFGWLALRADTVSRCDPLTGAEKDDAKGLGVVPEAFRFLCR